MVLAKGFGLEARFPLVLCFMLLPVVSRGKEVTREGYQREEPRRMFVREHRRLGLPGVD